MKKAEAEEMKQADQTEPLPEHREYLSRWDLILVAEKAMARYKDKCAIEENTTALLDAAITALLELREVDEVQVEQSRAPAKIYLLRVKTGVARVMWR